MSVAAGLIANENPGDGFVKERVCGLIRELLQRRSLSAAILDEDDLREAGLNSLDMVNLMLAVEAEFDLKIPDSHMTLRNFQSIAAINSLVISLLPPRDGNGEID